MYNSKTIVIALVLFYSTFTFALPQFFGGGAKNTENDVVKGICKPTIVIFARGTGESGNVGTVTGPPFFTALKKILGTNNVAVQGVDCPMNTAGIAAGGDPVGIRTMVSLVKSAASKCPTSKIVMSGYSQGAMVVAKAGAQLSASDVAKVAAVVNFGDPFKAIPLKNGLEAKRLTICRTGDAVCLGTGIITIEHLRYGQNAQQAADFVASKVK
ncbi:hypothetical protein HK098_005573 [Nowakowskiella sp. JEL0407]|nr:hypothetical protein HK098_005573 [Nowakowskiella sp. JEL0407]